MIMESGIDNWWYLVIGGWSSLKSFIKLYPDTATKIDSMVVMGGNGCGGCEPYPTSVMAPTDKTDIGCNPAVANYNLDCNNIKFKYVYYVPGKVKL